jgi:N-acylglucosamine-6-phosphate 2-epimerase
VISPLLGALRGRLVVSCQADVGSPLRRPEIMAALAQAAELGGAAAIRVQGVADVAAVRAVTSLPLIGLTKTDRPDTDVYITPTSEEAVRLCGLGCEIVAVDATLRPRPEPFAQIVGRIHAVGGLVMADVSTLEEARQALLDGADVLSTTLSGYTPYSPQLQEPDWPLMRALADEGLPFMAEGRIGSPAQARQALDLGALAVVVGSAITRPDVITRGFAEALKLTAGH